MQSCKCNKFRILIITVEFSFRVFVHITYYTSPVCDIYIIYIVYDINVVLNGERFII